MPLVRRIPKRGFNNIFAKPLEIVNVSSLNKFEDGPPSTCAIFWRRASSPSASTA